MEIDAQGKIVLSLDTPVQAVSQQLKDTGIAGKSFFHLEGLNSQLHINNHWGTGQLVEPLPELSGSLCSVVLHALGDKPSRTPYTPENSGGVIDLLSCVQEVSKLYEQLWLGT